MRTRTTALLTRVVLGALVITVAAACSDSKAADTASTPSDTGSDYKIVPAAKVAAGLAQVRTIAQGLRASRASGETQGRADLEKMYTEWFTFEGTVRKTDQNLYLAMEDGLGGMKIGVQTNQPDRITRGLSDFETAVDAYLAKHP